eukprot:GHVT01045372.1.p2 GENE.GHVT01045372.1~~GHVT01045372.1.p2  ORF type:complete len:104 (+),score=8.93 GHVT01045372.1:669-980(+)
MHFMDGNYRLSTFERGCRVDSSLSGCTQVMRVLTAIHLRQPNALEEATKAFFEAAWLRGLDVEDDEVLIQTLVSHGIASGHDAREFVHATSGGDIIPIRVAGF